MVDEVNRVSEHPLKCFDISDSKGKVCTDLGHTNLLDAVDAGLGACGAVANSSRSTMSMSPLYTPAGRKNQPTKTP